MLAFWRHGYETTSVADLTAAMGITPPSLYAAFGDKKRLFLEAVRLYAGDPAETERRHRGRPSAREAARALLRSLGRSPTRARTRRPAACWPAPPRAGRRPSAEVQAAVAAGAASAPRTRCCAAASSRTWPRGGCRRTTSPEALAGLTMAVVQGLSVLARDGAPRAKLLAVAEQAMEAWPDPGRVGARGGAVSG